MNKDDKKMYWIGTGFYMLLVLVFILFGFLLKPVDIEHSWEIHTVWMAFHPYSPFFDTLGIILVLSGAAVLLGVPTLLFGWEVYVKRGKIPAPALLSLGAIALGALFIAI